MAVKQAQGFDLGRGRDFRSQQCRAGRLAGARALRKPKSFRGRGDAKGEPADQNHFGGHGRKHWIWPSSCGFRCFCPAVVVMGESERRLCGIFREGCGVHEIAQARMAGAVRHGGRGRNFGFEDERRRRGSRDERRLSFLTKGRGRESFLERRSANPIRYE